jgi:nitrogen regulatory protein PII
MRAAHKVEIVLSSLEIEEAIDILETIPVPGYTLVKDVLGKGDRGVSYNDLGRESSNSYITIVCTTDRQVSDLVDLFTPLLKKAGGVFLVTSAYDVEH